ncbi:MerR family transcriptional regulator (plasmid) [Streptomyces sp. NBC_01216]|uniref:MerR family transcriptional regulator n=1 Tax=Streptomyces sp. NBC_01216 TaxID=2903778 RepID=UPI002E127D07|nr:MerR family transcriptional regulator [Streptomyces sp. NBC_01216]
MRLAELSHASGVSIPTIKYYIRDGLLPAGRLTGANQARYGDAHLHRLRLVRALVDMGGLPISRIRDVVAALDNSCSGPELLALATGVPAASSSRTVADSGIAADVYALARRRGWATPLDSQAFATAVEVLAALHDLGQSAFADRLDDYADAADRTAAVDADVVLHTPSGTEAWAESLVVGGVLVDSLLLALRRLAQPRPMDHHALTDSAPSGARA